MSIMQWYVCSGTYTVVRMQWYVCNSTYARVRWYNVDQEATKSQTTSPKIAQQWSGIAPKS